MPDTSEDKKIIAMQKEYIATLERYIELLESSRPEARASRSRTRVAAAPKATPRPTRVADIGASLESLALNLSGDQVSIGGMNTLYAEKHGRKLVDDLTAIEAAEASMPNSKTQVRRAGGAANTSMHLVTKAIRAAGKKVAQRQ